MNNVHITHTIGWLQIIDIQKKRAPMVLILQCTEVGLVIKISYLLGSLNIYRKYFDARCDVQGIRIGNMCT